MSLPITTAQETSPQVDSRAVNPARLTWILVAGGSSPSMAEIIGPLDMAHLASSQIIIVVPDKPGVQAPRPKHLRAEVLKVPVGTSREAMRELAMAAARGDIVYLDDLDSVRSHTRVQGAQGAHP